MGTVLPCREVLPLFRSRGAGKIVNLSGGGATAPLPRLSAYAASKAAVVRFTETLAEELRGTGHRHQRRRARRAQHPPARRGARRGTGQGGQELLRAGAEAEGGRGSAAGQRRRAVRVPRCRPRATESAGRLLSAVWDPWRDLPVAARRSVGERHLHLAADRSQGSRPGLGRHHEAGHRRLRFDRREAAAVARARARGGRAGRPGRGARAGAGRAGARRGRAHRLAGGRGAAPTWTR